MDNISCNAELSQAVNQAIKDSGLKKTFIAEKLGISRQGLEKVLRLCEIFSVNN